jgi:HK97 family phage portal protein
MKPPSGTRPRVAGARVNARGWRTVPENAAAAAEPGFNFVQIRASAAGAENSRRRIARRRCGRCAAFARSRRPCATAGNLSEEQFERLRTELDENYRGVKNAGRPLLLEGGLDWKSLSLTPKDMDFIEAKHSSAREIALAFGVPPMLLGIPGDNTYANYAEANRALYRQTVLPLAGRLFDALTNWLAASFGEGLRLVPDLDQVSALAAERESLWKRVNEATFLTDDERRAAVGYAGREA